MRMNVVLIIAGALLIAIGVYRSVAKQNDDVVKEVVQNNTVVNDRITADTGSSEDDRTEIGTPQLQVNRPETEKSADMEKKEIGDRFEDFVVNLLADWRLTLMDRTQDKVSSAGVIAESCKNPDLHVQQKYGNGSIDYYLECKYRSHWNGGEVRFDDWQIDRYRKFQRDNHRKVVIALGVGGSPSNPSTFMLVPLDSVSGSSIKKIKTKFVVEPSSTGLVEYMDNYFGGVFKAAKAKKRPN